MTETNRIEYKAQLTKDLDLEKEVVAFLNYREGGVIYIGKIKAHRQDLTFEQLSIYYQAKKEVTQ
jgi:hypothetical protein